jgi:hypothetical protein
MLSRCQLQVVCFSVSIVETLLSIAKDRGTGEYFNRRGKAGDHCLYVMRWHSRADYQMAMGARRRGLKHILVRHGRVTILNLDRAQNELQQAVTCIRLRRKLLHGKLCS